MQPGRVNQGASRPCLEWNGSFLSLGAKYIEILSSASSISDTHTHSCACAHLHPRDFDRRTSRGAREATRTA